MTGHFPMRTRCNVNRIGLTVWFSTELIRATLCQSRNRVHKALSSRSSLRGMIVRNIRSQSSKARFGRRWKFGATKASGVCRFTSHLESSHLLVTPASWPTYRDRHITNVTLYGRVCTHERIHACTEHVCASACIRVCRTRIHTCTSHASAPSSCKIGFLFLTILFLKNDDF